MANYNDFYLGNSQANSWAFPDISSATDTSSIAFSNNSINSALDVDVSSGFNWGNVGTGLNIASGLANSWLGFQKLALAKDQLAFQKNAWQEQFDIQKEEYDYQVEKRDARSEAYAEVKANQQKTSM